MIRIVINGVDDRILPRLTSWQLNQRQDSLTYIALRENDPHFSEYLDTVLVEGDEMEELVLERSVREIILEEWNEYYRLVEWMRGVGEPYFTVDMATLIRSGESRLPYVGHNYVYYTEIERIHKILDMPKYWEMCVINSYHDIRLYETIGRQVMELLGKYYPLVRQGHININYNSERGQAPLHIVAQVIDKTPEKFKEITTIALYGILHTAVLITLENYLLYPDPEYYFFLDVVDWSSALTILKNHSAISDSIGCNTLKTLSGEGSLDMTTIVIIPNIWIRNKPMLEYAMNKSDVEFLYKKCLGMFPDDVNSSTFGLTGPSLSPVTNSIASIVPYRHLFLLGLISYYARNIGWPIDTNRPRFIKANSSLLYNELGTEATRRILLSLLHSNDRGGADEVANMYANELKKILEDGVSEVPLSYPDRMESTIVQYLLWITQKK